MSDKFRIRLCSDLDYEEMVADICDEDHTVAIISQDKGLDKMEIEIFPPEKGIQSWKFFIDDLKSAIQSAKEALYETRENS